jgi:hypothetical protein
VSQHLKPFLGSPERERRGRDPRQVTRYELSSVHLINRLLSLELDKAVRIPEVPKFAYQTLKKYVYAGVIGMWTLNDKTKVLVSLLAAGWDCYLLSDTFKAKMSRLVEDLTGSANITPGRS